MHHYSALSIGVLITRGLFFNPLTIVGDIYNYAAERAESYDLPGCN